MPSKPATALSRSSRASGPTKRSCATSFSISSLPPPCSTTGAGVPSSGAAAVRSPATPPAKGIQSAARMTDRTIDTSCEPPPVRGGPSPVTTHLIRDPRDTCIDIQRGCIDLHSGHFAVPRARALRAARAPRRRTANRSAADARRRLGSAPPTLRSGPRAIRSTGQPRKARAALPPTGIAPPPSDTTAGSRRPNTARQTSSSTRRNPASPSRNR